MTAKTIKYSTIVSKVVNHTGYTHNRVLTIVKALSNVLVEEVKLGNDIDCYGLFKINYTLRTGDIIYNNNLIDLKKQIIKVSIKTKITKDIVEEIIRSYYHQISHLIEMGYQVNLKSIGYIKPIKENNEFGLWRRISPILVQSKPQLVDYLVIDKITQELHVKTFSTEDLRFKMEISPYLAMPLDIKEADIVI